MHNVLIIQKLDFKKSVTTPETHSVGLSFSDYAPVTVDSQRTVTRNFHVLFDLRLNKGLSKQLRRRWFETPSRSPWRHSNVFVLRILVLQEPIHSKSEMWLPCWVILQTDKLPSSSLVGFPAPAPGLQSSLRRMSKVYVIYNPDQSQSVLEQQIFDGQHI